MGTAPTIQESKLASAARLDPSPGDLVVYTLNVGDGDAIVIQFPDVGNGRAYAVVDSNNGTKTLAFLRNQLHVTDGLRFVCATHPHADHIRGLRKILQSYSGEVEEFWDSGFRYMSKTYNGIIKEVEKQAIQLIRPTSGFETFINRVRVTVLSPSIMLRNRYDTYGVDPNNASVVLRLEYPVRPPTSDFPKDVDSTSGDAKPRTRAIILSGDAQTDAWGRVLEEFPHLDKDESNWARQILVRKGRQPLACDVLKVAHHCSKHGINLELIERMGDRSGSGSSKGPRYLVSSCANESASNHGFPHMVSQEIMREVRDPQAKAGGSHPLDEDLGIHYTSQMIGGSSPRRAAGSIAVVFDRKGKIPTLYRLCDPRRRNINLQRARKVK